MVVGGFGALLRALAEPLDVRLSCPVASIDYGQEGRVVVTTEGGEAFEGAAAVVTLPLGVLKAGAVRFAPPLPQWKAEAVGRLGFGDLNKVVLQVRGA